MADISEGSRNLTSIISGLVYEIRPWQWYKQGILLLGIVFSRNLFDPVAWAALVPAVAAFTAVAGATYIFNDISDVEEDRNHPTKRYRPIASGQVPIPVAAVFAAGLFTAGLAIAYAVDLLVAGVLIAYIAQNVLYSLFLKEIVLVDILVVAIGFVLRAVAGVVAIDVYLSPWLIICTFLVALVLAFGKRRTELETVSGEGNTRGVLDSYSRDELDQLLNVVMATLLMAYTLYTFFRASPFMMLTLPFAFYGVFRYYHLVCTTDVGGNPEYLLTDTPTVVNLLLWGTVAIGVLYRVPTTLLGVLA